MTDERELPGWAKEEAEMVAEGFEAVFGDADEDEEDGGGGAFVTGIGPRDDE